MTSEQFAEVRFQSWAVGYHSGLSEEWATRARIAVARGDDAAAWGEAAMAVYHQDELAMAKTALNAALLEIEEAGA